MKLAGKVGVVIGGARNQGHACVDALLGRGAKVCIGDIVVKEDADVILANLRQKYGQGSVYYTKCDVSNADDIEGLFKLAEAKFGKVEVCANVAGIMEEFNPEKSLDVMVRGAIHCMTTALAHMGKDNGGLGGAVMMVSSVGGLCAYPSMPVYCGCKHFVVGYCRTWGQPEHYKINGVRVNSLCPTFVDTSFVHPANLEGKIRLPEKFLELVHIAKDTHTMMEPSVIGEALLMILDDEEMNGQAIQITRAAGMVKAKLIETPPQ